MQKVSGNFETEFVRRFGTYQQKLALAKRGLINMNMTEKVAGAKTKALAALGVGGAAGAAAMANPKIRHDVAYKSGKIVDRVNKKLNKSDAYKSVKKKFKDGLGDSKVRSELLHGTHWSQKGSK